MSQAPGATAVYCKQSRWLRAGTRRLLNETMQFLQWRNARCSHLTEQTVHLVAMKYKSLLILGTRGIPARHGGFETFAERISTVLVKRGWRVAVYCQRLGTGSITSDYWKGIELINVPVGKDSPMHTVIFDAKCMWHACRRRWLILTLGYNTGFLAVLPRLTGILQVINMDGIEWRRAKWSRLVRVWFYINEWLASWLSNWMIADHPAIARHLRRRGGSRKISVIPYGADSVVHADASLLDQFDLSPQGYALVVARPVPENSALEIVSAFSHSRRNLRLVVVGNYVPDSNSYHARVMEAAGREVQFLGAIYDKAAIDALRYYARFYIHGHCVGGTNPSLLEAMGAGCAILARDNVYNRWVAGPGAEFFADEKSCGRVLDRLVRDDEALARMGRAATERQQQIFQWHAVVDEYEQLFTDLSKQAWKGELAARRSAGHEEWL